MGPGEEEQGFSDPMGDVGSSDTEYPDQTYDTTGYVGEEGGNDTGNPNQAYGFAEYGSEEAGDGKFRGVCRHGIEEKNIWRGPIRSTYAAAEADMTAHQNNCPKRCNDCGVLQPADPGWD